MKNLQSGHFFIDAAVMWALKPLGMTMCRYIVVKAREFSKIKVLNIVEVELKQLRLHLLPHGVTLFHIHR